MTRFAQGTNQDYANAYNSWWFGGAGGPPPQRGAFGQDTPARPGYTAGLTAKQPGYGSYRPGMAQAMQPNGGGSPYAPQNQPSVTGWPDAEKVGKSPSASPAGRYAAGSNWRSFPVTDTLQPNPSYGANYGGSKNVGSPSIGGWPDQRGFGIRRGSGAPNGDEQGSAFGFGGPTQHQSPSFSPGSGLGNLAYSSPSDRPAPFEQSMNFMGRPVDPGQYYGQRDAFIQNINDARQSFAINPTPQRKPMDFGKMWGNAGDMVQQGWQNPLQGLMY